MPQIVLPLASSSASPIEPKSSSSASGPTGSLRTVAENDVVHADVAPGAGFVIHDASWAVLPAHWRTSQLVGCSRLLAVPVADSTTLLVHQQVHAGAALVVAAADQEGDVIALDGERPARQPARGGISLADVTAGGGSVAVDQPFALRPNVALVVRASWRPPPDRCQRRCQLLSNCRRFRSRKSRRQCPGGCSALPGGASSALHSRNIKLGSRTNAVPAHAVALLPAVKADSVLKPAGQFCLRPASCRCSSA